MELLLGSDGVLRDGSAEIGRIEEGPGEAYAALNVGGRSYEILREGRSGWRFRLVQASGGPALCEFKLARLRRGGVLESKAGPVRIGTTLAGSAWKIELPSGEAITVRGRPGSEEVFEQDGRTVVRFSGARHETLLVSAPAGLPVDSDAKVMVMFACWLIREWRLIPYVDGGGGGG